MAERCLVNGLPHGGRGSRSVTKGNTAEWGPNNCTKEHRSILQVLAECSFVHDRAFRITNRNTSGRWSLTNGWAATASVGAEPPEGGRRSPWDDP